MFKEQVLFDDFQTSLLALVLFFFFKRNNSTHSVEDRCFIKKSFSKRMCTIVPFLKKEKSVDLFGNNERKSVL